MERTRRLTTFGVGSCAALALLAGTAVGQMMHDDGMQRHDAMQKQSGMHMQQGDWKSAHQLPTRSDVILAGKTHDGRNVNVIFTQGRLESAELDQNRINPRQVQMKGDRIRIVDRGGENTLVTFTLPSQLASGGMIERRQFESDRFADQSFDSQRFGTRQRFDEDQQLGTTEPMRRTDSQWRFQEDQEFRTTDRTTTRDRFRDDRFRDDQMRDDRFRDDRFRDDRMRSTGTWQTDRELRMRERGDDRSWREQGRMQPSSRFQERRLETTRVYGSDFDTQPMILGITMSDLDRNELSRMRTERSYSSGVRVERVHEGMAADRAGLQPGDIIVRVDNEPATSNTLQRKASSKSPGESLNLRVLRDGRERNLNVRISSTGTTVRQFGTMDPWEEAVPPVQPEMPNVQHPGPYNVYRPTEPDWTNINRDTTVRSDRFRDDRFYGTDQRIYRDRPDRFDVREYRSDRYYTDTPPEFRDSRTYEFRTDPGQGFRDDRFEFRTDDRMYRTREFDSMDRPRDLRDDRFETRYRYEGPRSDRMHWDSGDARLHTTYEFDDDRFTTTYRLLEDDRPSADVRRGRIYGTDDRIYGTLDYDRDVYLDRNVDVRFRDNTLPGPMAPSTKFDNLDMPNVEHPGPFNIYRPTEPMVRERWEYRR